MEERQMDNIHEEEMQKGVMQKHRVPEGELQEQETRWANIRLEGMQMVELR